MSSAIPAFLWGIAGFTACASISQLEPSLLEEGMHLHVAQRLARGERLYQDVFAFTGPLPFEGLVLLFRIFGEQAMAARWFISLLHGLSTALTFLLARSAGRPPWPHVGAAVMVAAPVLLFPLFSLFYYTTLAFHISLMSAWAVLRSRHSRRNAFVAGGLAVAVGLCKQTVGAAVAATLLVALVVSLPRDERRNRAIAFLAGCFVVAGITLLLFAVQGGLGAFFHANVVMPLSLEETYRAGFPNLWPPGQIAPAILKNQTFYLPYFYILTEGLFAEPGWRIMLTTQILYASPFVALLAAGLLRVRGRLPAATGVSVALLVAWIANLFPRTDWGHLVHVLPFAVLVLVSLPNRGERQGRVGRAAAWLGAGLVVAGLVAGVVLARGYLFRVADPPGSFGPRVPQRPVSLGLRGTPVSRIIHYLREHADPGEALFVARAEPLLYFATDLRNPTPYPGVIPAMRQQESATILSALARTRWVVMSDVDQPAMTYYSEQLPDVQRYLERHYHIPDALQKEEVHWLVLLERGDDRGETLIDLVDERARARAFIRGEDGLEKPAPEFTDRLATKYNRRPIGFHLGARGGGLDFDIDVPANAIFQGDVGLWVVNGRDNIYRHPSRTTLRVSVLENGGFQTLASQPAMSRGADWRRWTPVEVDLSRYAGQSITLRLELDAGYRLPSDQISYWGSPRIVSRMRE